MATNELTNDEWRPTISPTQLSRPAPAPAPPAPALANNSHRLFTVVCILLGFLQSLPLISHKSKLQTPNFQAQLQQHNNSITPSAP
jgi:hypothetical protein